MKEWLLVIGALLIGAILFDGIRRARKRSRLKISIDDGLKDLRDDDYNSELPNGGARIVSSAAPVHEEPSFSEDALSDPQLSAERDEPPLITDEIVSEPRPAVKKSAAHPAPAREAFEGVAKRSYAADPDSAAGKHVSTGEAASAAALGAAGAAADLPTAEKSDSPRAELEEERAWPSREDSWPDEATGSQSWSTPPLSDEPRFAESDKRKAPASEFPPENHLAGLSVEDDSLDLQPEELLDPMVYRLEDGDEHEALDRANIGEASTLAARLEGEDIQAVVGDIDNALEPARRTESTGALSAERAQLSAEGSAEKSTDEIEARVLEEDVEEILADTTDDSRLYEPADILLDERFLGVAAEGGTDRDDQHEAHDGTLRETSDQELAPQSGDNRGAASCAEGQPDAEQDGIDEPVIDTRGGASSSVPDLEIVPAAPASPALNLDQPITQLLGGSKASSERRETATSSAAQTGAEQTDSGKQNLASLHGGADDRGRLRTADKFGEPPLPMSATVREQMPDSNASQRDTTAQPVEATDASLASEAKEDMEARQARSRRGAKPEVQTSFFDVDPELEPEPLLVDPLMDLDSRIQEPELGELFAAGGPGKGAAKGKVKKAAKGRAKEGAKGADGAAGGQRPAERGTRDLLGFEQDSEAQRAAPSQDEVLVITVTAQQEPFPGKALQKLAEACGMCHGEMQIFHRHEDAVDSGPVQFSMANAVKPGIFDLDSIGELQTPAVSFFLAMPEPRDLMNAFECMLATAKCVAQNLNGELKDEHRSVMRPQTIEHYRQRIRDFELHRLKRRS